MNRKPRIFVTRSIADPALKRLASHARVDVWSGETPLPYSALRRRLRDATLIASARLGAKEFAAMNPGAILVTTARGGVVDQPALYRALKLGHLGGAGLEVTDPKP